MNQQHFYRDGAQLPAHKLVLASQTSYFEGLFRQENPDQVAEMKQTTIGTISEDEEISLKFFYNTLNISGVTEF